MGFILSKFGPVEDDNKEKNIRKPAVDDELPYRVAAVLCYFFVLVVVGFPVWWYTTRVYRATLPLDRMYDFDKLPEKTDKQLGIPLNLEYDILVTFVNPEPMFLNAQIEGHDIEENLKPYLKNISTVANFTVKSQWVFLAQLNINSRKSDENLGYHALFEEDLPHVITPLEKTLWSHLTPRPCINLVLYIASCSQPLYIVDKQDQLVESNAFISPGWGGIVIDNPDKKSCANKYYEPNLGKIISTFLTQVQQLFNIQDVEEFQIRKAEEMIVSTRRTLKSLAELLSEIPSIVINDHVAEKVNIAVDSVAKAENFLKAGNIEDGLRNAKISYETSEAAFKDPSLLALLYFPDDQKYAVYIPLFLPVMIPVLMSLVTAKNWYMDRKKQKTE